MATTLQHEPDKSRYTLLIDGNLVALADYRLNANQISFNHTYTQPAHRGQGHAETVVSFAMDDVESTTELRVVPMCWYVSKWFEENPSRAALLTR
jgi:predicted GNAT family acetyltransferase